MMRKNRYTVVREYSSPTSKKALIQVLSRGIKSRLDAEQQMRFEQDNYPASEVYLVTRVEGDKEN